MIADFTKKMPQLSNVISLPLFVDAHDKETKYSGDANFLIANVLTESVNNDNGDIVVNCDSLNLIKIKEEPDDLYAMPVIDDVKNLLRNCDTATNGEIKSLIANKPTTSYLCHRCRQVFGSRDLFEVHYK